MGDDYGARYGADDVVARQLPTASVERWADAVARRLDGDGRVIDLGGWDRKVLICAG